jgi:NAD(P)-dependent dehydrogenase (short-subunit alcohol dehydrogenase family)
MEIAGQVVVVTGAANGIGKALAERFQSAGAKAVMLADIDEVAVAGVARAIGGDSLHCDVGQEAEVLRLIDETERRHGPINLFCSNAGIGGAFDLVSENAAFASTEIWQKAWSVNVMAHVFAARALIPLMRARGGPQGVDTPMLRSIPKGPQSDDGVLSPEACADCVVEGLRRETFLILPHPQVATYMQKKIENYDRWIGGMAKIQRTFREAGGAS